MPAMRLKPIFDLDWAVKVKGTTRNQALLQKGSDRLTDSGCIDNNFLTAPGAF